MDVDLIKNTTVANVYKGDRLAATLTRGSSSTTFEYVPGYVESGGAAVAHTLPASPEAKPVRTENGALPAFFAGLLPEGFRFSRLAQELKVSASD